MSEWGREPLDAVLEFREGPGILAKDFRPTGVPLIRLSGLKAQSVTAGCNFLDEAAVESRWTQFRLRLGDTLLSTSASLGEVAVVDESGVGAIPYTGIIRFRPRDDRVSPTFVRLMLSEKSFKDQVDAMGVGSVMKHFGPSHLRQMSVTVPPLAQQQAIAEVLGALDDKIAANTALASASERLVVVELSQLHSRVALGELAALRKEQVSPSAFAGRSVDHFSLPAFDADRLPAEDDGDDIKSAKFAVRAPAVLLSKLNPRIPRIWRATPRPGTLSLASTEFLVLEPLDISPALLWAALAQPSFSDDLSTRVAGTSGSHQRVRPVDALSVKVLDPRTMPEGLATQLEASLAAADVHCRQNRTLAATRDALLPQLMSGKLCVRDAEAAASAAGA